ncbi:MAG TPA: hypothetical protein VHE30_00575 [Polyangiaceae bacterium]|nr:hypothetical protein [Polyangiaceae bacterium]
MSAWNRDLSERERELLRGPLAVQVAGASARLEPQVCRGWGAEFADGQLTVILLDAQTEVLRATLAATRTIAVNTTHPVTLASLQWKGDVVEIAEPDDAARAEATRRTEQFLDALRAAGIVRAPTPGVFHPGPARRVTLRVREVFDQTPGPGAGREVQGSP